MALDTRQLRYFLEIAEQGSITRASEVLGVAQPALSMHLRTMEERLGTQLLVRSRSGVTPTEAGALLARRARTILDDIARTEDEIRTLDADPAGVVRLGLPGTISALIALPLIEAAHARYPRITITIAEAMSGFIADWMAEGRIDLAVLYEPSLPQGIVSEPLLQEELVVLWPVSDTRPPAMALSELDGVPMVLPSAAHGLRVQVDGAFRELGFQAAIALEIDSYANIKHLVAAGYGASILPLHAVEAEARAGQLRISHLTGAGLWRGAHLVSPSARPDSRAKEAIRALVAEVVGDLRTGGNWAGARVP